MQVQHLVMKDKRTPITVVQTGDETKVMPLLAIVLGAGIAVLVLYRKSKSNKKVNECIHDRGSDKKSLLLFC